MPIMVADKRPAPPAHRARAKRERRSQSQCYSNMKGDEPADGNFRPAFAASAAPTAREMKPVTAQRLPMPILVISAGSGYFFAQSRQKTTARKRNVTETTESSVISQVVGILRWKKTRSAWSCAQTR